MLWNLYLHFLYFIQHLRHCLLYILNLPVNPLRSTTPKPMELPITQLSETTLYSSVASKAELAHIEEHHPLHPMTRRWREPIDLRNNTPVEAKTHLTISPKVTLSGPLLKQGIIIQQKGRRFYLREELGRRVRYQDQITTVAVDLGTNLTYLIHIPISLFDANSVVEYTPKDSPVKEDSVV